MINIHIDSDIFNEVYLPYIEDYSNRFEVIYGGAGSGKSVYVALKILLKALKSKRTVLVVRKTLTSLRNSCWKLLNDLITNWQLSRYVKINKSEYRIEINNGSIFYIAGIDNQERIKSIVGITDIWVEEATELTPDDFDLLNLRMRANVNDSQVFASFNPVSKANWVYKRWFDNETKDLTNTLVIHTTYLDNIFLPQDYIEALENMSRTNPSYYKIYALGEFCSLDKLVYNNWKIEDFDYTEIQGKLAIGLDFGFTTDTTALTASIITEDTIYVFNEWGKTGLTNPDIAAGIKALGFNKSLIIADSAEPKSIEELRRDGIIRIRLSHKGPDSIIHGILKVQLYKIIVYPSCSNVITELENYSWQKDKHTGEYINKPIDSFNHYLDALRYSLQCLEVSHLRTIHKSILGL